MMTEGGNLRTLPLPLTSASDSHALPPCRTNFEQALGQLIKPDEFCVDIGPFTEMADEPAPMDDMDAGGEVMLSTEDAQSVAAALPAMEKIAAAVGEGEGDMMDEPEAEVDLDAELGGGDEDDDVPGARDYMQEDDGDEYELNEEELIEVVAQRVAQRLQKEKSMDDVVSQLAERILKKLED